MNQKEIHPLELFAIWIEAFKRGHVPALPEELIPGYLLYVLNGREKGENYYSTGLVCYS